MNKKSIQTKKRQNIYYATLTFAIGNCYYDCRLEHTSFINHGKTIHKDIAKVK